MRRNRREFLHVGAGILAASLLPSTSGLRADKTKEPETLRQKLWIWGHLEGSYDNAWGLPVKTSRTTPLQGAEYLGTPNVIMVRYEGQPTLPMDRYARTYREVPKLMWSFVGASGQTSEEEQRHVLDIAGRMPNMTGLFMDDFFHGNAEALSAGKEPAASISLADLEKLRPKLRLNDKRTLDLAVTFYAHQITPAVRRHLELCDLVSFWCWTAEELAELEKHFEAYQKIVPGKRTLLGIYMWDFGNHKPLSMDLMRFQCDRALKWLREKRIEGMIFLASNICEMNIEAVEYAKRWIAEHGEETIGPT